MKFLLIFTILNFTVLSRCFSQVDSNIFINSAVKKIEIIYNQKQNRVECVEKSSIIYETLKANTEINFSEFYNDRSAISNVSYSLNGKSNPFGWKPFDSFYQSRDIFYSDSRVVYFSLPIPKVNSELEIKYQQTTDNPRYFPPIYFTEGFKLKTKTIEIAIPNWFDYEIKEFNFDGYQINKTEVIKEDKKIITYIIENASEMKEESFSRGISYTYPHLLLLSKGSNGLIKETYFTDLKEQYSWYKQLVLPEPNISVIKEKALEIVKDAKTENDKISAIYYWIQENIRYIAFEDGIAGLRPAFASDVLSKKYGDCKGMANLAKEMLKSLNIDARLCWLGTNHINYNYSTPSLYIDNHMICAVIRNGKPILIDPTETYLSLEENAERIQDREILIENGVDFQVYKNPQRTYAQNLVSIEKNLKVNENDLVGTVNQVFKGESKSEFLSGFNQVKTNKSVEVLSNYLADQDPNYEIIIDKELDFKSYDTDINLKYDLKHKNGITKFDNEIYIDLDHDKEFKSLKIDLEKRLSDVFFSSKYHYKHLTKLEIPSGYLVKSLPKELLVDNKDYLINASYTSDGKMVTYQKQLIIKNTRISKQLIPQINKDFEALSNFYQENLILNKL